MDPSSITQLCIILLLLLLSAFFSSAETSLTTVSVHKLKSLFSEGNKAAGKALKLVEHPSKMLSAVLIGNNIVNISASALATTFVSNTLGNKYVGLATGILTLLVLIFGEITPKSLAAAHNVKLALLYAYVISGLTFVLTPVIWLLDKLTGIVFFILRIDSTANNSLTESELRTIVDASHEDGVIEIEEKKMITNVVDFGDSHAKDIMIPRVDVCLLPIDTTLDDIVNLYKEEQYSRIPIYEDSKDNIIGILNIKDLFYYITTHKEGEFNITDILREPFFTYEYQKTSVLLDNMKSHSIPMAIVLDEYGTAAGIVTLEDLLEEIVGDIRDEYDVESDTIVCINDNEYQVDASINLDDLNDVIGTSISSEDYDSLGGHIIELLDHLPAEGEIATEGNITYKVLSMDKNRIETVIMKIEPEQGTEESKEADD